MLAPILKSRATGGGRCVRTPANPTYYFGNYLLLDEPPAPCDVELWTETFRALFANEPRVRHVTLQWDAQGADASAFSTYVNAGFDAESSVTLAAFAPDVMRDGKVPRVKATLRPIVTDADWNEAFELAIELRDEDFGEPEYRIFKEGQVAACRRLAKNGIGNWFGAFVDGRLVADLGFFGNGRVFRYQNVGTHPEFRRLGLCDALVRFAARFEVPASCERAGTAPSEARIVIAADTDYHALDLYRKIGFVDTERHVALCRYPGKGVSS